MVIPVLRCHLRRHEQADEACTNSHNSLALFALQRAVDPINNRQHTQTDPDTEGIERSRVRVITLARLIRCLVEVNNDSQTRQEEQQERQREILPAYFFTLFIALAALPNDTDETQDERQEIIHVMSLVLFEFGRQFGLIAEHGVINKRNTGDPVSFGNLAVRLQVILTTREVPHEVPPVHEIHLVAEEETEVLRKSRTILRLLLAAVLITNTLAFDIRPLFVCLYMASLRRIHTREEHAELRHIFVRRLISGDNIMVLLTLFFRSRSILRVALFLYRHAHIPLDAQLNRRIISLAVEQRTVAVLLTVQIILQTEHIIRAVLIHRRVGVGTNHQSGVRAVTDEDHSHHQNAGIKPSPEVFIGILRMFDVCTFLRVEDCPCEESDGQYDTYRKTCIEGTSEPVNEQEFEPSNQRREAGDNAVQNNQKHQAGGQECINQPLPRELVAAEIIHQTDGRDGQQVQQVNTDGQSHEVRDSDQPSVTTLFVCLLIPFEDQPEDHRREER